MKPAQEERGLSSANRVFLACMCVCVHADRARSPFLSSPAMFVSVAATTPAPTRSFHHHHDVIRRKMLSANLPINKIFWKFWIKFK